MQSRTVLRNDSRPCPSSHASFLLGAAIVALAACREGDGSGLGNNLLDDADLTRLELSAGVLSVGFDPDRLDYSVATLSGIDSTTVTAITSDPDATIEIDGLPAISGTPSGPLSLRIGRTLIVVDVTAENGITTKTYTARVDRPHFSLTALSVPEGSVWAVNRAMVFEFNEAIDFSSVSSNTIVIESVGGAPASGAFDLRDERTVVFQPTCPIRDDLSDTGLEPGGIAYALTVVGRDRAANTVRALSGGALETTVIRHFTTPDFAAAFVDPVPGPPVPVVRPQGSAEPDKSYLELGGDPDERVFFERAPGGDIVPSVPGFEAPLNLYSDSSTRVALVIAFDQPIHPSSSNLSRLRLEFQEDTFRRRTIESRATLVANCGETGAKVRLEPLGILPQAAELRAVVQAGFEDLARNATTSPFDGLAVPTASVGFTSLSPADGESDELLESFDFGGDGLASLQDTTPMFDVPSAEWGAGRLSAAHDFDGSGGPNGNFDWVVRSGENFLFDTSGTTILGGPDGARDTSVFVDDGIVELRNLTIEEGGTLRVQGPNPMRIDATGEVRIRGKLDLSGFNASDVLTLNTGNLVEPGGAGAAGGGRGGNGNWNVTGPTPRGGSGEGAFAQANLGGQGGEMGISSSNNKNARRPGGGGGGRFSRDWIGTSIFSALSLVAGPGSNGNPNSRGAESGLSPASGGAPGQGPFLDATDANDFFGVRPIVTNGSITGLVQGELPRPWAGSGGGGGGNAGKFFPNPNWHFASDEKGGGGGGGAGGLRIKALGRIVFGLAGEIVANGGRGGSGENTNFLDHVGGTGGGGSGGHVILDSATAVDFTDGGANVNAPLRDFVLAAGPLRKTGSLQDVDTCGESSFCCPAGCAPNSNGGPGGAGVIQIHVTDPRKAPDTAAPADIRVPAAALGFADVLDQITSPPAYVMMPSSIPRSRARSRWISIGQADRAPGGAREQVRFIFGGLGTSGPDEGKVVTENSRVPEMAPLLQGELEGSAVVTILPPGLTVSFRGSALDPLFTGSTSGLSNDLYLRTPALLREFVLRLEAGSMVAEFAVLHAVYDEGSEAPGDEELRVTVSEGGFGSLLDFFDQHVGAPGVLSYALIPRFFRVFTGDTESFLPPDSFVRIQFQAAAESEVEVGVADEQNPLVDWTGDISRFNALPPGALQFFRFQVEFDLDAQGTGVPALSDPVSIDFLRIPFVF